MCIYGFMLTQSSKIATIFFLAKHPCVERASYFYLNLNLSSIIPDRKKTTLCAWSQNWKKESFLGGACDPLNLPVTEEMAASVCASLSMPLFLLGYTTWMTRWQEKPLWDTKGWSVPVRKEQVRHRQRCLWNQGAESWWVRAVSGNSCRVKLVDFCLEGKKRKIRAMKSSSSRQELFVTVKYKNDSSSLSPHLLCFHCLGVYFSTGYTDSSWEGKVWANGRSLAIIPERWLKL